MNKNKLISDLKNQYIKNLSEGLKLALSELVRSVRAADENMLATNFLYGTFPSNFKVSNMKRVSIIEKIIEVLRERYPNGTPVQMETSKNSKPMPIDEAISNMSSKLEENITVETFLDRIDTYADDIIGGQGTEDMANDLVTILYKIDETELTYKHNEIILKIRDMFVHVIGIGKKPKNRQKNALRFFTKEMSAATQRNDRKSNETSKGLKIVNLVGSIRDIFKM